MKPCANCGSSAAEPCHPGCPEPRDKPERLADILVRVFARMADDPRALAKLLPEGEDPR